MNERDAPRRAAVSSVRRTSDHQTIRPSDHQSIRASEQGVASKLILECDVGRILLRAEDKPAPSQRLDDWIIIPPVSFVSFSFVPLLHSTRSYVAAT